MSDITLIPYPNTQNKSTTKETLALPPPVREKMHHYPLEEVWFNGVMDQIVLFANNGSSHNNSTSDPTIDIVLDAFLDIVDISSFMCCILYVTYVVGRTLYTFPWRESPLAYIPRRSRVRRDPFIWRVFISQLQSQCYFFARPIARLIFFLLACDMLTSAPSMANIIMYRTKTSPGKALCILQALMTQFFGLSTYCWLLVLAVWMFWIVVLGRRKNLAILEICSHIFAWSVASILTIIPAATKSFGPSGPTYCWIMNDTKQQKVMRFATYYIPLWIVMILVLVICIIAFVRLIRAQIASFHSSHRSRRLRHLRSSLKLYIKLIGLPVVFILIWIFPTVKRLYDAINGESPLWLQFVYSISAASQGLLFTLIFFISEIVGRCCGRLPRKRRRDRNVENQLAELNLQSTDDEYVRWNSDSIYSLNSPSVIEEETMSNFDEDEDERSL